jgi:hypothetical protein
VSEEQPSGVKTPACCSRPTNISISRLSKAEPGASGWFIGWLVAFFTRRFRLVVKMKDNRSGQWKFKYSFLASQTFSP